MVITGLIWPNWRCWAVDIDRGVLEKHTQSLAIASGISRMKLNSSTLFATTRIIRNTPNTRRLSPWITTLGSRNRKRRTGLQYCPQCLQSDTSPYFRLQWRFAWHTVCKHHDHRLLDRCTHCNAPVIIHLLDAFDEAISRCHRCRQELGGADSVEAIAGALAFQQYADDVLHKGSTEFAGQKIHSCQEWFSLASFMVGLTRRASRGNSSMLDSFMKTMQASMPEIPRIEHGMDFESMATTTRHEILQATWPLLSSTHNELQNALSSSSMSKQAFVPRGQDTPPPLMALVDTLPDQSYSQRSRTVIPTKGPQPKRSVIASMATLERRLLKRRQ